MRHLFSTFIPRCLAPLLALSLNAQDITKGSITGVITDATGAVVAGATVSLTSPFGNRNTVSSQLGEYLFPNLIVGSGYVITVEKAGFATVRIPGLTVSVNQRLTADATLQVSATAQTVEVTATATGELDLAGTSIGGNIHESIYKNVPTDRNVSAVIAMAPGAVDSGGAGYANPSINGASGLENQYIINGANVTDPGFGGFGTFSRVYGSLGNGVNFDFVQEIQVKSGGFEAQYGQALGGVVNVLTKSGGNSYHGSLYGYFQPHSLEAERSDANKVTVNQRTLIEGLGRYDFGGDLGGYLIKNKLFWYGGFNPQFTSDYRSAPPAFGNSRLGTVAVKGRTSNYQGKLNYIINPNHQIEGSVFGDPNHRPQGFVRTASLATDDDLGASGLDFGSRTWTARYNGLLKPNWIVSANYSNYYNRLTETPKYDGYAISDSVPIQEGTGPSRMRNGLGFLENTESKANQFSVTSSHIVSMFGSHTLEYGYQFEAVNYAGGVHYTGPDFQNPRLPEFGQAAGQTMYGAFLIRTHTDPEDPRSPIVLQVARGFYSKPGVKTAMRYHTAFLQDSWTLLSRLTVRPGLRWEQQKMSGNVHGYTFAGNWAPRIGLAFDPTGKRKSKIFASWGHFFEKIPQDIAIRSFSAEALAVGAWYRDPGPAGVPDLSSSNYVPGGQVALFGGPESATVVAGGTKSRYQDEVVGGYEKEFPRGFTLSGRFVYRHLRRIIEDVSGLNVTQALAGLPLQYVVANPSASLDIFKNAFPCTSGPGCDLETGFTRITNPLGADGIADGYPNPSRIYKAIEFVLSRRFSANWQVYATYRLSKLYGNYEGSFRNDNGQADPDITSLFDFTNTDGLLAQQFRPGVLPTDRRHVLKIFGNYAFTSGILKNLNLGLSWYLQTGSPITQFNAHPVYYNPGEVPVGERGAMGRTVATFPLDLHADYTLKLSEKTRLKLVADMFNLFNQKRVVRVDQNFQLDSMTLNPDFLKPNTTTFDYPYQVPFFARLAVRLEF